MQSFFNATISIDEVQDANRDELAPINASAGADVLQAVLPGTARGAARMQGGSTARTCTRVALCAPTHAAF